ncbi:MAG: trehalose-phosphatase [Candidatus Binatia bacterium]
MCGNGRPTRISPRDFDAVILDLDGVVTRTAALHAQAWKRLFDEYLTRHAARAGEAFKPFDIDIDYRSYVDGKPRYEGVRSFLASRGIALPDGTPADDAGLETVCGLGNRKDAYFQESLRQHGVEVYDSTVAFIRSVRSRGLKIAVASSSKNCAAVLEAAQLTNLFEARVDGIEIERLNLQGKPNPDMFLEAAKRLNVEPRRAVVVEDAVAGVQAGRRGGFGLVVGVDRAGHAAALRANGADVVVSDLGTLVPRDTGVGPRITTELPSALDALHEITRRATGQRVAVFLDYDGTLTPIVERAQFAVLSENMKRTVRDLAGRCMVAIVSGRDRVDVEQMVRLDSVFYAGSHGFDISGPGGCRMEHEEGARYVPILRQAETELRQRLQDIEGVIVESKKFAVAVHYRLICDEDLHTVEEVVDTVAASRPTLRKTGGKKVFELRPRLDWDKGQAVRWLLEALGMTGPGVLSMYLGDDLTDEDAFAALAEHGIGIVVETGRRPTHAHYKLRDPAEVEIFLGRLVAAIDSERP